MLIFFSFISSLLFYLVFYDLYLAIILGIMIYLIGFLIFNSTNSFAFRELCLLLYAINYLLSPAITYAFDSIDKSFPMKISSDRYFALAIPGFILFTIGMYSIKTKCFNIDIGKINKLSLFNEYFLKNILFVTICIKFSRDFVQGELAFVLYLLGLLRYVAAFSLFSMNHNRNIIYPIVVCLLDLYGAFVAGAYHDAIMWLVFFVLFYVYSTKPKLIKIMAIGIVAAILILSVQAIKYKYRAEVWAGGDKEANIENAIAIGGGQMNSEIVFGSDNLFQTLNRANQAWIFASTVDNMDRTKDFQGMANVSKYLEAALLPRFLAPNKLKSGENTIFNKYSGHLINDKTSMGLGVFADGYIAYGFMGVYLFGFALGLIFSITFKIIEKWSDFSPYYALLLLPILNFAIRPDGELLTTLNHLFKSILLYSTLVYLSRKRFTLISANIL